MGKSLFWWTSGATWEKKRRQDCVSVENFGPEIQFWDIRLLSKKIVNDIQKKPSCPWLGHRVIKFVAWMGGMGHCPKLADPEFKTETP
ncbi:hypothetical protein SLE2022_099350 [Rubroshorea leprosula]